ncbi:hypothetical protein MRX96_023489 [Rhipicephalus microplus]
MIEAERDKLPPTGEERYKVDEREKGPEVSLRRKERESLVKKPKSYTATGVHNDMASVPSSERWRSFASGKRVSGVWVERNGAGRNTIFTEQNESTSAQRGAAAGELVFIAL